MCPDQRAFNLDIVEINEQERWREMARVRHRLLLDPDTSRWLRERYYRLNVLLQKAGQADGQG